MKTRTKPHARIYLTPSEQDKKWGIYATSAGYAHVSSGSSYPPQTHPKEYNLIWEKGRCLHAYAAVYITYGGGEFESAQGGKHTLREGSLVLLFPDEWHRYRPDTTTGWHEYWICFDGAFAENFQRQKIFSPERPVIQVGYNEVITRLFVQTLELAGEQPVGYQQIISGHLFEILGRTHAARRTRSSGGSGNDELIRRIRCALGERLEQNFRMEDLAKELHIGYSRFRRVFKASTGLSPNQYHLEMRIHRAKEILTGTNFPIKEIALQLGFESPYYFSRIFKTKSGFCPKEWRDITTSKNGYNAVARE